MHFIALAQGTSGLEVCARAQVVHCGNAVQQALAEALVRANLPEMCAGQARAA